MAESDPRILVIDDDPKMINLVKDVLSLIPCETLSASTVKEALAHLKSHRHSERGLDAVILDLRLPEGEEGFHILKMMKQDAVLTHIPVILVTGEADVKAKARGLEMGADDYVTKPFDPVELKARVGVVLRIRRTEQMLRHRNAELAALDDINRLITASLNLDEVLVSALEGLDRLVEADALAVLIGDEESPSWIVRSARTPEGTWLEGRIVPPSDPTMRQALREGQPILRAVQPESFWSETLNMTPLHILCVPFFKQREMVGALLALGQAPLDEEYLPLMQHIAATVGVAVDNAQLFQDLEAFAAELERSQNQLIQVEKMAAVGRLAASLAHEINNPLQAIQNSLHLALHKGLEEDRRRKYLEMVQQEVGRLVQIVRRMLDFYRPASAMKPLAINRPVEDALAIANKRLEQAQIDVMVRLEDNLPAVRGVENQLVQVFLNLILNAVEAMPDGGNLWVATAYHAERERVVIAFRDSGPGIAPEIREHLFEPFHTSKSSGTGLGLAISYGIIERHSGVINVESPPEGGTTFIVRLPRQKEEAE